MHGRDIGFAQANTSDIKTPPYSEDFFGIQNRLGLIF
jgi:hypothetical protein